MEAKTVEELLLPFLLLTCVLTVALHIQQIEASGTVYIRADGSVDPITASIQQTGNLYTFTDDIYDEIVVERSFITIDGNGYSLHSPGDPPFEFGAIGFKLKNVRNVLIRNTIIEDFKYGFWVESSRSISIYENSIVNAGYSLMVLGSDLTQYLHTIDSSNTANDRPIYYVVNQSNLMINSASHPQIGYLAFINCYNLTIEEVSLTYSGQGLLLVNTNNSRIMGSNITENHLGLDIRFSFENTILENYIANNRLWGINLYSSASNIISRNNVYRNARGTVPRSANAGGIFLSNSDNNTLSRNNVTDHYVPNDYNYDPSIKLEASSNNTVSANYLANNHYGIICENNSQYNRFTENKIEKIYNEQGNNIGIWLDGSSNNNISDNELAHYVTLYKASNNLISRNNITNSITAMYESSNNEIFENNVRTISVHHYSNFNSILQNEIVNGGVSVVHQCRNNTVSENWISNSSGKGVFIGEDSGYSNIYRNTIAGHQSYAIHLSDDYDSRVSENTIVNNGAGIALYYSLRSVVSQNTITNNSGYGIHVSSFSRWNLVSNNSISNHTNGILLQASENTLADNRIKYNSINGIQISGVSESVITRNIVENGHTGIWFSSAANNLVSENTITNNWDGIGLDASSGNDFYHNNFLNNSRHIYIQTPEYSNNWNRSSPSEGNYWDNYERADTNSDGIGDQSYEVSDPVFTPIEFKQFDYHPLMGRFSSFNTSTGFRVEISTNSTIDSLQYFESNRSIVMQVSNLTEDQSFGFFRIAIPRALVSEPYNITIDGDDPAYSNYSVFDDGSSRWLYFTYEHSTLKIIISKGSPFNFLQILIIASIVAAATTSVLVVIWKRQSKD